MASEEAQLRISEVARRTGVPAASLRAWEQRYALLTPERTASGYRLYSGADVLTVEHMQQLLANGMSAGEAARVARRDRDRLQAAAGISIPARERVLAGMPVHLPLTAALAAMDGAAAHLEIDHLLAAHPITFVLRHACIPAVRSVGDAVERGELTIAHEHFASNLLRGRMLGLGRTWDAGDGPRVLLACAPGDMHDLGLIVVGLSLHERDWRVTFLGADTPFDEIVTAADELGVQVIVISMTAPPSLAGASSAMRQLQSEPRIVVAGPGATPAIARRLGAIHIMEDPIDIANHEVFAS